MVIRADRALVPCRILISQPGSSLNIPAMLVDPDLQIRDFLQILLVLLVILLFSPAFSFAQTQPPLSLMPLPAQVQFGSGQVTINRSFSVGITGNSDAALRRAVNLFLDHLATQTGMPRLGSKISRSPRADLLVHVEQSSKELPSLGEDESYSLEVSASSAKLTAATRLGVIHGLETFLQLVQTGPDGFFVPALTVHDQPRFPWRGLMIDVSRHFIPLDVLKRNLDGMAAMKLNVFHWHLSDDQGFRIESKKFPRLQTVGSDGLFYTQDQVRELIRYAADRGIRVIPEFDMPGHTSAWFVGYPELASGPGPYRVEREWGIFDAAMDPTQERTYEFLDKFIGEMATIFPDRYFHIGGDEVDGGQWFENPRIQTFMRAHGFKNKEQLQAYFDRRLEKILRKHGKTMLGWDEIMQPGIPKDIVIQAWREQVPSPVLAAKQGFRGLMSYGYYLDLMWPAWQHYAVDPTGGAAATLLPEEQQRILGGEACIWSEYVSPENIDSRIWPRLAAIAERLWSPAGTTDVDSMYERLDATSHWLDWLGLTHNSYYEPMLRRLSGASDIAPLRMLADVVEPVKDYTREETAPEVPTSLVPLDRLIDAVYPESRTARNFSTMVDQLIAGHANEATTQSIRTMLLSWHDNQAKLEPLESQSFLLKEIVPLSQSLSAVASVGLQALDYLDHQQQPPSDWKMQQLALLRDAEKPKAQLLLMVAPPVEKLVEFAAAQRNAQPRK